MVLVMTKMGSKHFLGIVFYGVATTSGQLTTQRSRDKTRNTAPRNSGKSICNGAVGEKQNDNMYCSYTYKWAAYLPGKLFRKIATVFKTPSCRLKVNMSQNTSRIQPIFTFLVNENKHHRRQKLSAFHEVTGRW